MTKEITFRHNKDQQNPKYSLKKYEVLTLHKSKVTIMRFKLIPYSRKTEMSLKGVSWKHEQQKKT